jgi:hypothetical protein
LIGRAQERCATRAAELRQAHAAVVEIGRRLDPPTPLPDDQPLSGAAVRAHVEAYLEELAAAVAAERIPDWLRGPVGHMVIVLRRLGDGLYHCYDVPALPRTDNALEQFYRRVKSQQRRITGRKRADAFVVRVGGFAVYATASSDTTEADLRRQLARVPAVAWQQERARLRANQLRQTKMHRFQLHRATYLADLEARWALLADPP